MAWRRGGAANGSAGRHLAAHSPPSLARPLLLLGLALSAAAAGWMDAGVVRACGRAATWSQNLPERSEPRARRAAAAAGCVRCTVCLAPPGVCGQLQHQRYRKTTSPLAVRTACASGFRVVPLVSFVLPASHHCGSPVHPVPLQQTQCTHSAETAANWPASASRRIAPEVGMERAPPPQQVTSFSTLHPGDDEMPSVPSGAQYGSALSRLSPTWLAVGVPWAPGGGTARGEVHLQRLDSSGSPAGAPIVLGSGDLPLPDDAEFGAALSLLPPSGGGGTLTLAVGAPGQSDGVVYLLKIHETEGFLLTYITITPGVDFVPSRSTAGARFGSALAALADRDGDGVAELAVCAEATLEKSDNLDGSLFVLFMDSAFRVKRHMTIEVCVCVCVFGLCQPFCGGGVGMHRAGWAGLPDCVLPSTARAYLPQPNLTSQAGGRGRESPRRARSYTPPLDCHPPPQAHHPPSPGGRPRHRRRGDSLRARGCGDARP